jgi:hypothetical protein
METGNGLATYVACTAGKEGTIGVEFYNASGAFVDGDSSTAALGQTVMFGTAASTAFTVNVNIATAAFQGYAKVVGSSSSIVCSAFIADGSTTTSRVVRS